MLLAGLWALEPGGWLRLLYALLCEGWGSKCELGLS